MSSFDLVILDFDGVCVRTVAEQLDASDRAVDRPGAIELVRACREADVTTLVLSNEIDPAWASSHPILGEVDQVVNCADNRIFKPDRRAFQRCLLLTGVSAERTLVIDDDPDNVAVASSLGMETVLFDTTDPRASWAAVEAVMNP